VDTVTFLEAGTAAAAESEDSAGALACFTGAGAGAAGAGEAAGGAAATGAGATGATFGLEAAAVGAGACLAPEELLVASPAAGADGLASPKVRMEPAGLGPGAGISVTFG
jgi:hypothetical protein